MVSKKRNGKLRPHQIKAIEVSPDKWGLFFGCRVGKTPTAIGLADTRAKTALVICPKSVVEHWKSEIEKWQTNTCLFLVISRDQFKRKYKELEGVEAVIVDEAHSHFSNYSNEAFKALKAYSKDCKYLWLLTGTPKPASSWAVYCYGILMGRNWKWLDWDRYFFNRIKMGRRMIPVPKSGTENALRSIILKIGTVISLKDVAEVMDDEDIIETFSLSKEQEGLIKDNFDPLPIVRYTRQHQLEQGVLKSDGYKDTVSVSCEKDKRVVEIVNDNKKTAIVCRYHDQINKYKKLIKGKVFVISGKEKMTASELTPLIEKEDSATIIIQSDTCEGYSLKSIDTMVFASMSYSFVNYEQMRSRIKSMDKKIPCEYIHLLTEGKSIDRAVYDCVIKKQDFDIKLYEKI